MDFLLVIPSRKRGISQSKRGLHKLFSVTNQLM